MFGCGRGISRGYFLFYYTLYDFNFLYLRILLISLIVLLCFKMIKCCCFKNYFNDAYISFHLLFISNNGSNV